MNPLRSWTCLPLALALGLLTGCGGGSGKTKVAFVTNNPETFWTIAEAGCKKAEAEFGVECLVRKPDSGNPARQKEIIDILLGQNIQALAVSVIDPKNQKEYLDEVAARVPLITQDNDAPDSKRLCYIGTDNYKAGRTVGKLVKECMPDGGTIAIFVGQLEPLNARQRRQGVLDELADAAPPEDLNDFPLGADKKAYGKYRLHGTFTDQPRGQQESTEKAKDVLTDLAGEKNVCLIGLWAYNPPAILTAVEDKGRLKEVKIVGFDEDDRTLEGIAQGHIHGTVVQDPYGFGYQAVRLMAKLAQGDKSVLPKDGLLYVPERVITRDGGQGRLAVKKFQDDLEAMLGKK